MSRGAGGAWVRAAKRRNGIQLLNYCARRSGFLAGTTPIPRFITHFLICANTQMTPQPTTSSDATETGTGAASDTGPCCTTVGHDLSEHTVEVDVRTLSAMGNETRYEVLRLLAATDEEVCSCDLAPELDVDQSTTSRALKALYEAGLVDRRKDGRWRYYTTTQRAETLLSAIDTSRGE